MSQTQQRSNISPNSRSASQLNDSDELTDSELIRRVQDLKQQIKIISLENEIIERTILRVDPALMNGVQQALDYAQKLTSSSSLNVGSFKSQSSKYLGLDSITSPSRILTSPSKVSTRRVESSAKFGGTVIFGTGPRINVLEKSELVSNEMERLADNMERARTKAAKQHALLKAQIEEIDVRENDIRKASEVFKQEVLIDGWDKIAQRIPAEIWIRFMTEWVKITDSHIGKLRLRTSTLNTQYNKLKGQIKVKAELSESLRPVDFEKLKIENRECDKIIDMKMQQLEELKSVTGDANLTLTVHKNAMMEQNNYLTNVLSKTEEKRRLVKVLAKERDAVKLQADSLDVTFEKVKKVRLAYEVPDMMEYVYVKAELADLKNSVKTLENRLRVQQITLKSLNKKLNLMLSN